MMWSFVLCAGLVASALEPEPEGPAPAESDCPCDVFDWRCRAETLGCPGSEDPADVAAELAASTKADARAMQRTHTEPPTAQDAGSPLSWSVSIGPGLAVNDGSLEVGGTAGAFFGVGAYDVFAIGLAGQAHLGATFDYPATYVTHRHWIAGQGRSPTSGFMWRAGVGVAAIHEVGYGLLALAPSMGARFGWWSRRRPNKPSLFVAADLGFELAIWHIPIPLPFVGIAVGVGRL